MLFVAFQSQQPEGRRREVRSFFRVLRFGGGWVGGWCGGGGGVNMRSVVHGDAGSWGERSTYAARKGEHALRPVRAAVSLCLAWRGVYGFPKFTFTLWSRKCIRSRMPS